MAAGGGDYKEHLHALALYDKNVPIRRRLFMTATPKVAMVCLLYTSPSPRDVEESRMPSSA